jgi:hypothetical protein
MISTQNSEVDFAAWLLTVPVGRVIITLRIMCLILPEEVALLGRKKPG